MTQHFYPTRHTRDFGAAAAAAAAFLFSVPAFAQVLVPQAGANPIDIDQSSVTDNIQVLLATQAERSSAIAVKDPADGRKNFWIYHFLTTDDYLAWTVSLPAAAPYQVAALLAAANGQQVSLTVNGGSPVQFTARGEWDKLSAGTIDLPAGIVRLVLRRTGDLSGDVQIKSLELLRASAVAAYNARVAAARGNTEWLSHARYGLMFQYGPWGFPDNVGPAKSLDRQAADFDVPGFVAKVAETGASYVIWSISWWGYHMDAPLRSPNMIVTAGGGPANPGLASTTDLIGDVAAALHSKGIRFLLYYHCGAEDGAWWPYQHFPAGFSATGTGDRSTFLRNWETVVTEIGNRYGATLDAFLFDDGMMYYPAPFEKLERVARAGNPNRLVSWNAWIMPRFTDFQDIYFGEGSHGEPVPGSTPPGGNGIFTSGAQQGLLQHSMFVMDGDWGVHTQGGGVIKTDPSVTSAAAIGWARSAASRNIPISFDLMMYEDGTVAESDLAILNDVRQSVYGSVAKMPTGVHSTVAHGDSLSFTFDGTGVDLLGPRGHSAQRFSVTLDRSIIGEFSASAEKDMPRSVLYSARHLSAGRHTIALMKRNGSDLKVDAFRVVANPTVLNDKPYVLANGEPLTVPFVGTGIELIGPMGPRGATANVSVDGMHRSTIQTSYPGPYAPRQHYLGVSNLDPGPHILRVSQTSGASLQIDQLKITP